MKTQIETTNKKYTEEQFLRFIDLMTDQKFEFADGEIIPVQESEALDSSFVDYVLGNNFDETQITKLFIMATAKHDTIISNLHTILGIYARTAKKYAIYSQGTHVRIDITGRTRMPDILVVEKKDAKRNEQHQLLNPKLVMEVLSKSTQSKDKNEKLDEYQSIESLEEYVLISQDQHQVIRFSKIDEFHWNQEILRGLDKTLSLDSIDFVITLADIYADAE